MKYAYVALVAAGLVAAQNPLDYFPECAISCLDDAISSSTSCEVTDYSCQCESANQSAIQAGATSCVVSACGADTAVNEVLPAAEEFCAAVAAGGDSTTTEAATSEATPTETATSEETPTEAATSGETTMETSTPTMTGNGTSATTTPVEVNAASGPAVGFFAAALAALAAL